MTMKLGNKLNSKLSIVAGINCKLSISNNCPYPHTDYTAETNIKLLKSETIDIGFRSAAYSHYGKNIQMMIQLLAFLGALIPGACSLVLGKSNREDVC